ncbi:MAG: hypothetical protein A2V74_06730 [Acidobacteria bacterium RBG_16_70_10]|nr:MAG: hypothetical protein A2V74_06730 [Acidobacteria bacterium RBG_16_70_10]
MAVASTPEGPIRGAEGGLRRGPAVAAIAALLAAEAATAGAPSAPSPGRGGDTSAEERVEIRASRGGFRPRSFTLRRGETVRVVLRSDDVEHCFALDAHRIEKRIVPGRTTEFELTPDRVGVLEFYCCLEAGPAADAERGQIVVNE